MHKDDEVNALELEILGLDIELANLRGSHRVLVEQIAKLETNRSVVLSKIMQLRWEQHHADNS